MSGAQVLRRPGQLDPRPAAVGVADHDRALELAAKIPDVTWGLGAVEVRPIMEFTRDEEDGGS